MASVVNVPLGKFPDGTLLRCYLARAHPPGLTKAARGVALPPPDASGVATATVAGGSASFAGLTVGQLYIAAAKVGAEYRQLAFVAT